MTESRPAVVLRPGYGRHDARHRLGSDVGHQLPDRGVGEYSAVRRHAVRPAVKDRMEQRPVGAPIPPAPVYQAWTHEANRARAMAAVAVHCAEKRFALLGRARVCIERIDEGLGRGREVAGRTVLIVAHGRRRVSC